MIEIFKDNEIRTSGLIYNSVLEQIKELYQYDPEQAGELAISAIELVLTGDISTDDVSIRLMLKPMQKINENNVAKYENKKEVQKQKKIQSDKLDKIAELMLSGMKQREIGERLGISQQLVSYRVDVIKKKHPELLQIKQMDTKDFTNNTNKNKNTKNEIFVEETVEPEVVYTKDFQF